MAAAPEENRPTTSVGQRPEGDAVDLFVRLMGENQRRLSLYVLSLTGNWNDAEEILQETNLVLWREFHRFEPGTNFTAWAHRIAFNQMLAWTKKRRRDRLSFSPDFLEAIASETPTTGDGLEDRLRLLRECIQKLPVKQREMIRFRYAENLSIDDVAVRCETTANAAYRALSRIRKLLHDCVTRSQTHENHP